MPSVLITGASRGLGLEFARQYGAEGWRVFACCRDPGGAPKLAAIAAQSDGRVTVHGLDVRMRQGIAALAAGLEDEPVDLLLNNAGVYGPRLQDFGEVDDRAWAEVLDVNVMGPLRMAEAFAKHIASSQRKLIVTLSSRMGSMSDNSSGGAYVYRSSKAAVNAVVKSLAVDLGRRGIVCVAFHPGWVRTDMGGAGAALSPELSVANMRRVIEGVRPADNGRFLSHDGGEIPW